MFRAAIYVIVSLPLINEAAPVVSCVKAGTSGMCRPMIGGAAITTQQA